MKPNSSTFGSLIGSCASANVLQKGKQYHALVLKSGLELDVVVGSAIMDMYSKCGEMDEAITLFHILPTRDLVSWNGIICGLALSGKASRALDLFDEMVREHQDAMTPNNVTFIGVLSACSHAVLVNRGYTYFSDMVHKYCIRPQAEHCAYIVDQLPRAGLLRQAESLLQTLPPKPDEVMWSALLGACRRHRDFDMAKRIAQRLAADKPRTSSNYVLLANMHAENGAWNDAMSVREVMCLSGALKVTGNSWIESSGQVHSFRQVIIINIHCKILYARSWRV